MSLILVVDDAQTDRELLGQVVTHSGHRVMYSVDGREAITMAKQHRPSLIFLDVVMPGLDGFAACRALSKDPETAAIPVVLVTSKSTNSDMFWGKKQGASDHITKPWDRTMIEGLIRRFCR